MNASAYWTILMLVIASALLFQFCVFHLTSVRLRFPGATWSKSLRVFATLLGVALIAQLCFALLPPIAGVAWILVPVVNVMLIMKLYGQRIGKSVVVLVMPLLAGLAVAVSFRTFAMQPFRIPTTGMEPALLPRDHVYASKFDYRFREPERGDIVVFEHPENRELVYVKRVLGLPGETIEIRDSRILVGGVAIEDPWADLSVPLRARREEHRFANCAPILLSTDAYFVLGDNRFNSLDSRFFGPVGREAILGRVTIRYWPPARMGGVE